MKKIKRAFQLFFWAIANPKGAVLGIRTAMYGKRGFSYTTGWKEKQGEGGSGSSKSNPLKIFFDNNTEGHGIWKFEHYFEAYDRHFKKFIGKEVHVVEVGIYSGGSLNMWKSYFGDKCKIYGVDIIQECMGYEDDKTKVFIGDQENREFWKKFKEKVPRIDILIDDGGHLAEQQIVTLEEILEHISPGGVYLCEDVTGFRNKFTAYMNGVQNAFNNIGHIPGPMSRTRSTAFQQQIASIHQYPYIYVIEKRDEIVNELKAPKHGTIWGPFFEKKED